MNPHRYILYARKSSEDKSRQVTSIEDQIKELKRIAQQQGLNIVEIIFESKSAKKPGREGFNALLEKIHQKKADAILCWKLDRLARNPIDHGNIAWMLQQGIIKRIRTHSNEYKPTDNVLMMQVEFGMATQYIKDLNVNVSRGTRLKAERGWYPSPILPVGYKHNPLYLANESIIEIVPDPQNFNKVKQLWELLLSGGYSVMDLKRHGDAIGIKNKKGNLFSLNTYHLLFKKPFYAGGFFWKDEHGSKKLYQGKHQTMISYSEFETAQKILGNFTRPSRTRERIHQFPFRGHIFCGECSGYITAEEIHQVICTHCKYKYSVKTNTKCRKCEMDYLDMVDPIEINKKYYRCNKKKNSQCTQKSIEEHQIMVQAESFAKYMQIDEDFYSWAVNEVEYLSKQAQLDSKEINLDSRERELSKRLTGLITMKADGKITDSVFDTISNEVQDKLLKVQTEKFKQRDYVDILRKRALKRLALSKNAYFSFTNATAKGKKQILKEIGYNLILKDKTVSIITPKWISYLKSYMTTYRGNMDWVQPKNNVTNKEDFKTFTPLNLNVLAEQELKRTCQIDHIRF